MVISRKQLTYSVGAFIFGASLLTSNLYYFAENDSWVSVLIGLVASLMIVGLYTVIANRYPGLGLAQINKAVFGKTLGKIVSGLYAYYFLSLAYFNTRNLGDFINSVALHETPIMLIFILFTMVCAWAVRKGPLNIARYGFLAVFIAFAAIVFNGLLLINRTHLDFLQPALTLPPRDYLIGAHIVTMLPFCEIIAFMTFIPYLRAPEAFGSAMRRGLLIGAAVLMLIVLRDITVLGPFTAIFAQPTFSVIRYIDIGDILTRLEIIYAVILMSLLFFKVSVVYYATVNMLSDIVGFNSYKSLVFIVGALIVVYSSAIFSAVTEHIKWNMTAAPTYSTFFLVVLPLVTIIISFIRGTDKRPVGAPSGG